MSDNQERLLGALQEFKKTQHDHNKANREEHREMMNAIKALDKARWKLHGAYMAVAAIMGAIGSRIFKI